MFRLAAADMAAYMLVKQLLYRPCRIVVYRTAVCGAMHASSRTVLCHPLFDKGCNIS